MTYQNAKREITELGEFLYQYGYIVATDGNISARLNSKQILITRTGICKGEMIIKDIVKIGIGDWDLGISNKKVRPSSEYHFHLAIYKNRPDINAVIHAHPPYATVFAVTGKKLDTSLLTETTETLGKIKNVGFYKPGSMELAKAVGDACKKHNTILLAHHGVVVCGENLLEARYRLERLEFLAKVTFLSSL